jgi:hypothetical protein
MVFMLRRFVDDETIFGLISRIFLFVVLVVFGASVAEVVVVVVVVVVVFDWVGVICDEWLLLLLFVILQLMSKCKGSKCDAGVVVVADVNCCVGTGVEAIGRCCCCCLFELPCDLDLAFVVDFDFAVVVLAVVVGLELVAEDIDIRFVIVVALGWIGIGVEVDLMGERDDDGGPVITGTSWPFVNWKNVVDAGVLAAWVSRPKGK